MIAIDYPCAIKVLFGDDAWFSIDGKLDKQGKQILDENGDVVYDPSTIRDWDEEHNGGPIPTQEELDAVAEQAITLKDQDTKDTDARKLINTRKDKALRMILKFVATMPSAPQPLKDMAAEIANAETDLKGDT